MVRVVLAFPAGTEGGDKNVIVGGGFRMVTVADADWVEDAAVMVTVFGEGRLFGATYMPALLITPIVWFPPVALFTDQVTVPLMVVENCSCPRRTTCAVAGLREPWLVELEFACVDGDCAVFPPQLSVTTAPRSTIIARHALALQEKEPVATHRLRPTITCVKPITTTSPGKNLAYRNSPPSGLNKEFGSVHSG